MEEAILASETEMVTVAMKRIEMENKRRRYVTPHRTSTYSVTSQYFGCTYRRRSRICAQMAREAFGTNWLKLEIHPDPRYLLPIQPKP